MSAAEEAALVATGDDLVVEDLPEGMLHQLSVPDDLPAAIETLHRCHWYSHARPLVRCGGCLLHAARPVFLTARPRRFSARLRGPYLSPPVRHRLLGRLPHTPRIASCHPSSRDIDPYENIYFTHLSGLPIATPDNPIPFEIPLEEMKPPMLLNFSSHLCTLCANNHRASDHSTFAPFPRPPSAPPSSLLPSVPVSPPYPSRSLPDLLPSTTFSSVTLPAPPPSRPPRPASSPSMLCSTLGLSPPPPPLPPSPPFVSPLPSPDPSPSPSLHLPSCPPCFTSHPTSSRPLSLLNPPLSPPALALSLPPLLFLCPHPLPASPRTSPLPAAHLTSSPPISGTQFLLLPSDIPSALSMSRLPHSPPLPLYFPSSYPAPSLPLVHWTYACTSHWF
ncbi:unnamed protein product [Closterium sp. Naga37s-1]|nr:unnamed protein product [Closterium sp. Naga37s-1]